MGTPQDILTLFGAPLAGIALIFIVIAVARLVCPDGWSGYGGVARNGCHAESGLVAGLPSFAASWIAVIGRQDDQRALSTQTATNVSAADMNESA